MRLLVADTQFPKGHSKLNHHLLDLLAQVECIGEIKVLNYRHFYKRICSSIRYYNLPMLVFSKNAYVNYIFEFLNSVLVLLRCLTIRFDKIIFFTFNTLSFGILSLFIFKPIYLIHHNNTDHLLNKYKRMFFKLYMNKVNHIVFADFIRDYLISIGVKEGRISLLPHPLLSLSKDVKVYNECKEDDIYIALGHANDESLISELIEYEQSTHLLKSHNIKLVLRSASEFRELPESIEIINSYLSDEQYAYYYQIAKGVLILYSEQFRYRYSGALLDALVANKIVCGRSIPIMIHFSNKYPNCCVVFNNISDLVNKICCNSYRYEPEVYNDLLIHHNDLKISICLNEILL